jgi:hypothetical protein
MEALVGCYTQKNPNSPRIEKENGKFQFVGRIFGPPNARSKHVGDIFTHLGNGLIYNYERGTGEDGVATRTFVIEIEGTSVRMEVTLRKREGHIFAWDGLWGSMRVGNGGMTCRIIDPLSFEHEG